MTHACRVLRAFLCSDRGRLTCHMQPLLLPKSQAGALLPCSPPLLGATCTQSTLPQLKEHVFSRLDRCNPFIQARSNMGVYQRYCFGRYRSALVPADMYHGSPRAMAQWQSLAKTLCS